MGEDLEEVGKKIGRSKDASLTFLDGRLGHLRYSKWQQIPVDRVVRFVVATAMRQDEIVRVEWSDFDSENKMRLIRDRKDPQEKGQRSGNPFAGCFWL